MWQESVKNIIFFCRGSGTTDLFIISVDVTKTTLVVIFTKATLLTVKISFAGISICQNAVQTIATGRNVGTHQSVGPPAHSFNKHR